MRLHEITRVSWLAWIAVCLGLDPGVSAEAAKNFRISAVQEMEVWIEGGLLDGLEPGMDGEVCYEISIGGRKRRIIPARVRLSKVEDHESIGVIREQSGTINIGYSAAFVPKPASDLLLLFNERASEAYAGKDFELAERYYRRILEALPGDAYASQRLKDCEAGIEKLNSLARERRNLPYYREVIRTSLDANNPEALKLARSYADKILLVEPGDPEALRVKKRPAQPESVPLPSASLAAPPPVAAKGAVHSPTMAVVEAGGSGGKPVPDTKPPVMPDILANMVLVPEGDYSIGSPPGRSPFENESPKHPVHLAAFYLDRHEVTNEEYKRFCDATGRPYPGYFSGKDYPPGAARKPVTMVNWTDADAYARWAGKRLPSEIEWEAAASGPSGRTWPWGGTWIPNQANTREKGEEGAAEVGSHPLDVSEFGAFDMAGNVSEWTQDSYRPYPGNNRKEKEYGERFKVLRGGSSKASKEFARSQFRARLPQGYRSIDLGFRCAVSAIDVRQQDYGSPAQK